MDKLVPPPQEVVEVGRPLPVARSEALEGGGLLRCVVIDMRLRVPLPVLARAPKEAYEGLPLLPRSEGPLRRMVVVHIGDPPQVFHTVVRRETGRLQIEEPVVRRGFGQG